MTQKSVGSDTPSSGWDVAGSNFDDHRGTGTVFFVSEERPGLWLSLTLLLDGTETVTGFEVRQQHPERPVEVGISTRLLRSVPLGRLAHEATRELRNRADRAADPKLWRNDSAGWEQAMLTSLALHSVPQGHTRPGRRGHPLEYYAILAVEYEKWRQTGERFAILAKRHHMSESALRAALSTARRKGLLTNASPGRAGGIATEQAKTVLRAAAERPECPRSPDLLPS